MITLYTFGPAFGLPDPSPFVVKAELLLKMSGLPYCTDTHGFRRAPKGKLPYIDDAGVLVADSSLIRCYLEEQHAIDFDAGFSPAQRGCAWAVEKMLEDQLYWPIVAARWGDDANFARGPALFFRQIPWPLRPMVQSLIRRKIRMALWAQGMGRHSTAEQLTFACRAIDAVAQLMGAQPYLLGETPCGADAAVFAFLAGAQCPHFETPLRAAVATHPNLVAYIERMQQRYYPNTAPATVN